MAGLVLSLKCANKALMMKALAILALLLLCVALVPDARAQDRRQNEPGQFDFYVLALSWSPSFCASASERGRSGRNMQMQCGGGRSFAFVVHGLWPQYERGFPEYCQRPAPRVSRDVVSSMLDLMPAPGLIFNEWDKHGVCSGLSVRAYFETTRKARAGVKIPDMFLDLAEAKTVSPAEVEDAFIKVNPGLKADDIAVICDRNRLTEVRVCFSKDLGFRSCGDVDRRACRRDAISVPPVRGGN